MYMYICYVYICMYLYIYIYIYSSGWLSPKSAPSEARVSIRALRTNIYSIIHYMGAVIFGLTGPVQKPAKSAATVNGIATNYNE